MSEPPFGLRDYLAYGTTGVTTVVSAAFAVRGEVDVDVELSATQIVLLLIGSYILGHVLAEATAPLVSRLLGRWLGGPISRLLSDRKPGGTTLGSRYTGSLSAPLKARVVDAAERCGLDVSTAGGITIAGLGSVAAAVVREVHETPGRVERYGLLEDFCRNIAAASAVASATLLVGSVVHREGDLAWVALAAAVLAVVMAARFLHFQRLYWTVVLVAFTAHVLGHGAEPTDPSG